ncbi:uncharacterized protein isoform X2 [Choristoneura fumiferana]|uniref:uncharacterized protein isoform X2 n=1 Tax=Choristoneura fumiferana TaxID=7141 RepID=UPI003D15C552
MESPRKFNDCYFYYYSTCTKGDNCVFRHEPSALGCETMCSAWQQGKCMDKRCKLRHMELRKNRKQIPCYWENQPGGCRKKHCPFMHKNPDARTDGIAPSQPLLPSQQPAAPGGAGEAAAEQPPLAGAGVVPAPAPVPLFWQQQRQVLDPAILDALPASNELLGARRLVPHAHAHAHGHAHAHAHPHDAPNPYAPLPVDPLVVNFEEESDNESAPSTTPTKPAAAPSPPPDRANQELLLLEKIQAEAAAYYRYDNLTPDAVKERKIIRTNFSTKYDRLSLDEISGKQANAERRSSLDFKILSLDEIRARKKTSDTIVHSTPITLNLSRKRKLSTQESVTTSGDKIIKVVRSNSVVYKKVDHNATAATTQAKPELKLSGNKDASRKRTVSEQSDVYEVQEDELVDNCYEFKRIKVTETTSKPRLIRNSHGNATKESLASNDSKMDTDSDTEVQIVSIDISDCTNVDLASDIIDVETSKMGDPVDIVDLSDDEECEVTISDYDLGLIKNVPDVVASCQKNNKNDNIERDLLSDIDNILSDVL